MDVITVRARITWVHEHSRKIVVTDETEVGLSTAFARLSKIALRGDALFQLCSSGDDERASFATEISMAECRGRVNARRQT